MEYYLYVKSLHIIFVVTWFAGLFYIVRLFIYHVEAEQKPEVERVVLQQQFKIMERRLWYGITWPSMILTFIFGFWLVYMLDAWTQPWFLLKFCLVIGLFFYHLHCGTIYRNLKNDHVKKHSSIKLRIWNEVATLFLVSIVFVVVLKNTVDFLWGILGLIVFSVILLLAIRISKRIRENRKVKEAK